MHSSLVLTTEGVPLGLAAVKVWTRQKFNGTAALKKKINPTRVPIEKKESVRWLDNLAQSTELLGAADRCVHIGDRESDIYELFSLSHELGTHFVLRTCVNRRAGDGDHTVADEMSEVAIKKRHRINVRDNNGDSEQRSWKSDTVRSASCRNWEMEAICPSRIDCDPRRGSETPRHRKKISWKLITDLPVDSARAAIEKLEWYAMRWKIEVFHKILKSGCRAEDSRLRTAQRLANLIAIFCIVSWRVFWMTMLNRRRQIPQQSWP